MSFTPLSPGMLLDAASRFAQDHAGAESLPGDPIREMGWACTLVPEDAGGVGGTLRDLCSIVEGLAAHGVHLPVVEACAVVPLLLQAASATDTLQALCEGGASPLPLAPLAGSLDEPTVQATAQGTGFELTGEVQGFDVSLEATQWLVPATLQEGGDLAVFLVDAQRLPAPAATYRTMEGRRAADARLDRLTLPAEACLLSGGRAHDALVAADNAALLLTAVDSVATLAALIEQTAKHLTERRQFGVALSTFQALRHRSADMVVRYLGAKGLLQHALQAFDDGAVDLRRTLRLMKLSLAETARACAESAIQMHGGMGLSEEVLATRLAQRLLASEFRYGDRLTQASRLLSNVSRSSS